MKNNNKASIDEINMLAIDPGTTTIGVSIFTINIKDLDNIKISKIETILIDTSLKFVEEELTKDLLVRLRRLYDRVFEILKRYDPVIVSIENGFINRLRPAAYGPLSQSIMAIELAAGNYNKQIKIFKFAPKTIKKVTTKGGAADKDGVLLGVNSIKEITSLIDPNLVSEHEVDSIAVNYTMLEYLRENTVILYII